MVFVNNAHIIVITTLSEIPKLKIKFNNKIRVKNRESKFFKQNIYSNFTFFKQNNIRINNNPDTISKIMKIKSKLVKTRLPFWFTIVYTKQSPPINNTIP